MAVAMICGLVRAVLAASFLVGCSGCAALAGGSDVGHAGSAHGGMASGIETPPSAAVEKESEVLGGGKDGIAGVDRMPDDVSKSQEESALDAAYDALTRGEYGAAFRLAASCFGTSDEKMARSLAVYAASQLPFASLSQLSTEPSLGSGAQKIVDKIRIFRCGNDLACLRSPLESLGRICLREQDLVCADGVSAYFEKKNREMPVVAAFLPLSGKDRKIGRAMLGALLLASGIFGGILPDVALRFFDTQSSSDRIPALIGEAQALGVKLILGPLDIQESFLASSRLPDGIVMVGFSPNDEFIGNRLQAFQFSYALSQEMQALAAWLVGFQARRIAATGVEGAYADAALKQLRENLPEHVALENAFYPSDQTDLRDVAKRIASWQPDAIFLPTPAEDSERIMSFLAQENVWCRTPGTPPATAKDDMRKFVSCVATSAWAPIGDDHHYRFIVDGIYPDYAGNAAVAEANFSEEFQRLYHRKPSVYEVLPFAVFRLLAGISKTEWQNAEALRARLLALLGGQRHWMIPGMMQIGGQGVKVYKPAWSSQPAAPVRAMKVR